MARHADDRARRVEDALVAALFSVLFLGAFALRFGRERGASYRPDILLGALVGVWLTIRVLRVLVWPQGRRGKVVLLLSDAVIMLLVMGTGILYVLGTYDHPKGIPTSERALAYGAVGGMGVALGCTIFRLVRSFYGRGVASGSLVDFRPDRG